MAINAVLKFLQAARNLAKQGMTKEQILDFARREFGEVSDFLKRQIDSIFKKGTPSKSKIGETFGFKNYPKTAQKKKGEVVPIKEGEGILATDEAAEILAKRTDDIATGDPTGETSDLMTSIDTKVKSIKKAADEMKGVADDMDPMGDFYNILQGAKPRNLREGVVRAAAREILNKNKVNIGREDPINIFRQMYGEDGLEAVDAVSDSLLEAQTYGEINTILKNNKLFDLVPKKTYGYDESIVAAEKIRKAKEQEAKNRQILEEFDPKDRTENADGGLIDILKL
jgi:hypothetical protein